MREYFLNDFLASIVVFLVALPLCMGISIAAGLPVSAGIITGIVGGGIVSLLSGCPLQVSGPAAGLVVVVIELIQQHGIESLGVIITLAGLIQVLAGFAGLGQWFRAVPPSVIHGMLSGIGVLLMLSQFHVMVDDSPKGEAWKNLISIPEAIYKGIVHAEGASHHLAAMIGVCTIVSVIIWDKLPLHKLPWKWVSLIPGALVAIVAATAIDGIFDLPIKHVELPANLLSDLRLPSLAAFTRMTNVDLLVDAVAVAFIATAETMLTATALDKLAIGHRTKYDREMKAQGVGNMICGLIGVLPMTGVIVRSGVNVKAGGRTRLSSFLHGVWLLLFVSCAPHIVRLVPISSLAALLVLTGYKLVFSPETKELRKFGKSEMTIFFVTLTSIVFVDLLTGVLIGVLLSIAKLLYHFSHMNIRKQSEDKRHKTSLYLSGAATFLSLPKLAQAIEDVPADSELHVHLEDVDYIDHACLDLLMTWDKQHRASGGNLVIDWGTLGAMYRDRRRTPRGELVAKDISTQSELMEILQGDDDDLDAAYSSTDGDGKGKSADEKAREAGDRAKLADKKAKAADKKAKSASEKAKAANENARVANEGAKAASEIARAEGEKPLEADGKTKV
ncbi:MAG: SulP family inorganic anion transporter [Candidatus Melainabacteria bacterium]|nr:SulP family inorganic anion transporter [Candidatus Melainabacteria bacterium]